MTRLKRKWNKKLFGMAGAALLLLPAWPAVPTSADAVIVSVTDYGADGTDALDDTTSLQAAIDAAVEGVTVRIPAGTYIISAPVQAKSGIKLIGDGRDSTILKYAADSATAGYMLSLNQTDNVEVAGLTLDGNSNVNVAGGITSDPTPAVVQNSGHYIHDNRIENLGATSGFGPFGILIAHTDHVTIADNDFLNMGTGSEWGAAIRNGWDANYPIIERNTIADTGRGGIFLNDGVEGAIVRHNAVTGSGKYGLGLSIELHTDVNHALVEDNQVDHWLSVVRSSYDAIRRNTVHATDDSVAGIGLEIMSDHTVTSDNIVDGGQQVGLQQSPGPGYQYWGYNQVRNMVMWGMQLQGDGAEETEQFQYFYKNSFENTQADDDRAAYTDYDGYGVRIHGNSQNLTFDSNQIVNNEGKAIDVTGAPGVDRISFINNVITGNAGPTIETYPDSALNLEWSGNTVSGNGTDTQLESRGFADAKPAADFNAPETVEPGTAVTFENTSQGNGTIAENLWDFGEGVPSTVAGPTHTYEKEGTYRVTLVVWNEDGRASLKERTIVVKTAEEPPVNPPVNNGGGYVPPVAPNPNNGVYTVSSMDLAGSAADGSITIAAKGDVSEIQLPPKAAELPDQAQLTLQLDTFSATIPSAVLKQLAALVTADELKQGTLVFKAEALSADQARALIAQAQQSIDSAAISQLSSIYAFSLYVKKADGTQVALNAFDQPIHTALSAKVPQNDSLAGVYAIGENGTLLYAGGQFANSVFSADLTHFSAYAALEIETAFRDLPAGHWAEAAIKELAAKQLVQGAGDGLFQPAKAVTRAEFSVMLANLLWKDQADAVAASFTDQEEIGAWAADAVAKAVQAGIISGYGDGSFRPNQPLTRAEMAVILAKATKTAVAGTEASTNFTDDPAIPEWAKGSVAVLAQAGLVNGRADGSFDPGAALNRAEAGMILFHLLHMK